MTSVPLVTTTGYQRGLALVCGEIREGQAFSEQAGLSLAVRVVAALEHLPEWVR